MNQSRVYSNCTAKQFERWRRDDMKWGQQRAANELGISKSSVFLYEKGEKRGGVHKVIPIPVVVTLAMAALSAGLKPVGG